MRTRPTALTPEVAERIISARRAGLALDKAAKRGGVTRQTLFNWLKRGEVERPSDEDAIYVDFSIRFGEAEADRQAAVLSKVDDGGPNAKDHLRLLELSYPQDFGARQIVEHTGAEGGAIQVDDARARLLDLLSRRAPDSGAGEGGGPASTG